MFEIILALEQPVLLAVVILACVWMARHSVNW